MSEDAPAEGRPTITITFEGPASSEATVRFDHTTKGQIYEAAWLLDAVAREVRQVPAPSGDGRQILVPAPGSSPRVRGR